MKISIYSNLTHLTILLNIIVSLPWIVLNYSRKIVCLAVLLNGSGFGRKSTQWGIRREIKMVVSGGEGNS